MLLLAVTAISCREEDVIYIPETVDVSQPVYTSVEGMYVLNEGLLNYNNATLDYMDFTTGQYTINIYSNANPDQPKELGDVGNDLGIYGSRLYAVINTSNKVEIMDKRTLRRLGQVDIPNCRFIKFHKGYAYVTSYAGPVSFDPDLLQLGYVAKVDTATMQVVDRCLVGYQPDELEIVDDKIYVVNSGGYMVNNYENTMSVIDLNTFKEIERVSIAINLQSVRADKRGMLWIVSRGDYVNTPSNIYVYDLRKERLVKPMDVPASAVWMDGDLLYVTSNQWSNVTMSNEVSYAIINTATLEVVSHKIVTDGTEIENPYGIAVNPITKDIYIADARQYKVGRLYCFDHEGKLKWNVRTGEIPGHFAFLGDNINEK